LKGLGFQLAVGFWLSMGVIFGLGSRSVDEFIGFVWPALFLTALGVAMDARKSESRRVRHSGTALYVACTAVVTAFIFIAVERYYLVDAQGYPSILAKPLDLKQGESALRLREGECKNDVIYSFRKAKDIWIVRCGFDWFTGSTYITHSDPFPQKESVK
jgi:hypothetical protein